LGFNNADGDIRTHDTAKGAEDAVLGPGLEGGKMPFGIDLVRDFKNVFGADVDTKPASLAPFGINYVC